MPPFPFLSAMPMGADLITALRDTDFVGLLCLLLLLAMSLRSGYFIFLKMWQVKVARAQSEEFIAECREGHKSLEEIYKVSKEYPESPLAILLRESFIEYEMDFRDEASQRLPLDQRIQVSRSTVESALERSIAGELRKLESRLIHLATASTLAPFIGLFGTVWGVLGSFQALGREGNAALSTLAPGISTALTTTIFGLIVAIPSVYVYNKLSSQVSQLSSQMDSFAHELTSVFQKNLLQRGVK